MEGIQGKADIDWKAVDFSDSTIEFLEEYSSYLPISSLPLYFKEIGQNDKNWIDYIALYSQFIDTFVNEMIAQYSSQLTDSQYDAILKIRESAFYSNKEYHASKLADIKKDIGIYCHELTSLMRYLDLLEKDIKKNLWS